MKDYYLILDTEPFSILDDSPRGGKGGKSRKGKKPIPKILMNDQVIERAASIFKLLGDPARLRLILRLQETQEIPVFDLAIMADMSESAASHALRLLRAHGIVKVRRVGKFSFYSLRDSSVRKLLEATLSRID